MTSSAASGSPMPVPAAAKHAPVVAAEAAPVPIIPVVIVPHHDASPAASMARWSVLDTCFLSFDTRIMWMMNWMT